MIVSVLVLLSLAVSPMSVVSQQPPASQSDQPAVSIPDTPAGKALKEFVTSFNESGEKRRAWLESRTTFGADGIENILKQDIAFLEQHGAVTVVRVMPNPTATKIMAVLRHAKTGAHGHLTMDVEAAAPHKVADMQLRGATPEEVKGK